MRNPKPYYNTTQLQGSELAERNAASKTQEEVVFDFFLTNANHEFTPFEVMAATGIACINSVRRSITNLTQKGKIRKTDIKRIGQFGQKNYCWILLTEAKQKSLF
jgi:uncharacterized protein (DUF4213/DUF364 family)